ncbi:MAG: hypothetical protein HYS12_23235 [Planctomycetes bacterium]|nr:hypothetical protein [Planctomycetota bacterium]
MVKTCEVRLLVRDSPRETSVSTRFVEVRMTLQEEMEALAQPEGRVVSTLGHEQARQHLVSRLQKIGLSPYRGHTFGLPYRAAGRDSCVPASTAWAGWPRAR